MKRLSKMGWGEEREKKAFLGTLFGQNLFRNRIINCIKFLLKKELLSISNNWNWSQSKYWIDLNWYIDKIKSIKLRILIMFKKLLPRSIKSIKFRTRSNSIKQWQKFQQFIQLKIKKDINNFFLSISNK